MTIADRFNKPHYLYRPSQVVRRFTSTGTMHKLPWDIEIEADRTETIGAAIARTGVYDLVVTEALWRLTDPGDVCVDAGANIGYMTSVLARRAGATGRVISFEPSPSIADRLERNTGRWGALASMAPIEVRRVALSDAAAGVAFCTSEGDGNDGLGRVTDVNSRHTIVVDAMRLDATDAEQIGIMKVDVEGHEDALFEGAAGLLRREAIRDIVFEEHEPGPTDRTRTLERHGYTVFRLQASLRGPSLLGIDAPAPRWDPPSLLATNEPLRAEARIGRGWRSLRSSRQARRR